MNQQNAPVIVVVGSLHYDIMVDAPDRPRKGETVTGTAWRPKFGGKGGNQAIAAAGAGASVRMAGAVGDDGFGSFLLDRLKAGGVDAAHIAEIAGIGSGMSVAISDSGGDYGAVIVSGSNLAISLDAVAVPELWAGARALILQNEVPEAVNVAAATAARRAGALVCLNAAPARALSAELSALVDILVVNAIEAEAFGAAPVTDLASASSAAAYLSPRFPVVVVTAGGDGVAGIERGSAPETMRALPVELVSTHGAGDVFVGALVASLVKGSGAVSVHGGLVADLGAANAAAAHHVSRLTTAD